MRRELQDRNSLFVLYNPLYSSVPLVCIVTMETRLGMPVENEHTTPSIRNVPFAGHTRTGGHQTRVSRKTKPP